MLFFPVSAVVLQEAVPSALNTGGSTFLWIALLAGLLGLIFALFLAKSVLNMTPVRRRCRRSQTRFVKARKLSCRGSTRPSPRWRWFWQLLSI